jgi:hypothetical protein
VLRRIGDEDTFPEDDVMQYMARRRVDAFGQLEAFRVSLHR